MSKLSYVFRIIFRLKVLAKRPKRILVKYKTEDGSKIETEWEGFRARVFSHELCHLDGTLFFYWSISECDIKVNSEEFYFLAEVFLGIVQTINYYKNQFIEFKSRFPQFLTDYKIDNGKMIDIKDISEKNWEFENAMDVDMLRSVRKDWREKIYKTNAMKEKKID